MHTQPVHHSVPLRSKDEEMILVVKREVLIGNNAWHGIKPLCFDELSLTIQANQEFHPRGAMEQDSAYKQIIPYLVFAHEDTYFLMQRSAKASETRLQNQYTLGIGGHIRQEDIQASSIIEWARREFHEEINYTGELAVQPIGLLNDDSNAVGRVHIGVVFLLKGATADISVKSELQSGTLMPLEECMHYHKDMETWSQIVLMHLLDVKYGTESRKCCG